MTAVHIGVVELTRRMRDPVNVFFVFAFPVILILLLGVTFGGSLVPKLALVVHDEGFLAREILGELRSDDALDVVVVDDEADLLGDVERGVFEAGVIIPSGYTEALRSGRDQSVTYVAKPGGFGGSVRSAVDAAVSGVAARLRAARVAQTEGAGGFTPAYETATAIAVRRPGIEVAFTVAGGGNVADEGQFDTGAATQLILFTFVNSLAGSVGLVQTRQLGVLRRMLAAPIGSSTILLGQTLGRCLVALVQGLLILVVAALLFGVDWDERLGASGVINLFALVSTGAAMLFGAILANEQQAGALVPFGLAVAALGGSMVPLEIFPDTIKTIAHATPHAWANEAFAELIGHGAKVADILPQLGALLAFAAVLLGAASWLLRRKLTS